MIGRSSANTAGDAETACNISVTGQFAEASDECEALVAAGR
jgi:hypothetical protein